MLPAFAPERKRENGARCFMRPRRTRTNGSDISRDDGKTWRALDDGNWNALSLPFVVGPKGRIGRLNAGALPKP